MFYKVFNIRFVFIIYIYINFWVRFLVEFVYRICIVIFDEVYIYFIICFVYKVWLVLGL